MPYRCAVLALLAIALLAAAPAPKPAAVKAAPPKTATANTPGPVAPKPAANRTLAPDTLAHANAIFLNSLSKNGQRSIQVRTAAINTHFFLEEAGGVSVYQYDGKGDYKRVEFLKGAKLAAAEKKYK
jgi:hypothetical protein